MSTLVMGASKQQPFECQICHSRFTRHENLKRHADLHSRPKEDASLSCHLCRTTFSRRDLRERHYRRKHPGLQEDEATDKTRRRDTLISVISSAPSRDPKSRRIRRALRPLPAKEHIDAALPTWDSGVYDSAHDGFWNADAQLPLSQSESRRTQQSESSARPYLDAATLGSHAPGTETTIPSSVPGTLRPQFDSANLPLGKSSGLSPPDLLQTHHASLAGLVASPTPSTSSRSATSARSQSPSVGSPYCDVAYSSSGWYPSFSQIARGLDLYFAQVSHFVPFLHRPTFDVHSVPRHLMLAILSNAYQHGEDPDLADQTGSGERLAISCFHHGRLQCASIGEEEDDLLHNLTLVQTLLLLEICAMMHMCGKTSKYGMKMHWRMVSIARSAGMMGTSSPSTAPTKDLDSMWRESSQKESLKRTIFAAHQIDALWYQFLSVPRSLSHLEIKHELPQPADCWNASSAAEWAHNRLAITQSKLPVQYTDAVRQYLSCSQDVETIPPFDPFGAVNIAYFLLSSAREVSGWSAMTGQLSLDRFEALRASLVTLASSLCPQGETAIPTHSATRAATWEMAMIEFFIWSPAHTSGIVEGNLDAMLSRSTQHALTSKLEFQVDVVAAIQPHLDWFMRYLDATREVAGEAPWVVLFAYRAFLLTWQLLREGIPGAMAAIGVKDGDADAAVMWAKGAFGRRAQWQLSKLVLQQIDLLGDLPCI